MSLSTLSSTTPTNTPLLRYGLQERRFQHIASPSRIPFDITFPLRRSGPHSFTQVGDYIVENEVVATRRVNKRGNRPAYQYEAYATVQHGALQHYTILGSYTTDSGHVVSLPEVCEPTAQQATNAFLALPEWPTGSFSSNTRISGNIFCCVYADANGKGKSLQDWLLTRRSNAHGHNKKRQPSAPPPSKKRRTDSSSSSSSSSFSSSSPPVQGKYTQKVKPILVSTKKFKRS